MNSRQVRLTPTVMTSEGNSSPEVRSNREGNSSLGVRSNREGHSSPSEVRSSPNVRSSISGSRKEHFEAAPRSVFGSSGSKGKEVNDISRKTCP